MKIKRIAAAIAASAFLAFGLSACSSMSSMLSTVESVFSSSDSTANALAYCAGKLYTIAANTTKAVVETDALTADQLNTLKTDNDAVMSAIDKMTTALEAGEDVDAAAFTTAWETFEEYLTSLGITLTASADIQVSPAYLTASDAKSQLAAAHIAGADLGAAISNSAKAMK